MENGKGGVVAHTQKGDQTAAKQLVTAHLQRAIDRTCGFVEHCKPWPMVKQPQHRQSLLLSKAQHVFPLKLPISNPFEVLSPPPSPLLLLLLLLLFHLEKVAQTNAFEHFTKLLFADSRSARKLALWVEHLLLEAAPASNVWALWKVHQLANAALLERLADLPCVKRPQSIKNAKQRAFPATGQRKMPLRKRKRERKKNTHTRLAQ